MIEADRFCQTTLQAKGAILLRDYADQVNAVVASCGEKVLETEIAKQSDSALYIHSDEHIAFHTEQPEVKIIALQCVKQATRGGESLLVDGDEVYRYLPHEARDTLSRLVCPIYRKLSQDSGAPILKRSGGETSWYYVPWYMEEEDDEGRLNASDRDCLALLKHTIENVEPIVFRMNDGDVVVFNNNRMLHSRTAFEGERILKRFAVIDEACCQAA